MHRDLVTHRRLDFTPSYSPLRRICNPAENLISFAFFAKAFALFAVFIIFLPQRTLRKQ